MEDEVDATLELEQKEGIGAANYAFLNHSTATLPNNLPPNVDNKPLARQKRKRTSPEDQAVLEAAYQHDPKPDKTARLELVKRIALGEKEVQIWFQNRRQTSRRKSRPLLPHEIAQYQLSRTSPYEAETPAIRAFPQDASSNMWHSDHGPNPGQSGRPPTLSSDDSGASSMAIAVHSGGVLECSSQSEQQRQTSDGTMTECVEQESGPKLGYLANRRSMPSLRQAHETTMVTTTTTDTIQHPPEPVLKRRHSLERSTSSIRLSMTSEGNAKVITKDTITPSPPRPLQLLLPAVNQEQVVSRLDLQAKSAVPVKLRRSASGRSRDSRAWEFWCDKDSRSELEQKAEKDGNGSAADAIGLIRSTSNRRVLSSIPSKRNAEMSRHQLWRAKRANSDFEKPSLERSYTSNGRLQHRGLSHATGGVSAKRRHGKLKYSESAVVVYNPGNDSDKENRSPVEGLISDMSSEIDSAETQHGATARKSLARAERSLPGIKGRRTYGDENARPEADPEVAAFMRQDRKSSSISGEEELDCVQGLLSLSQGTWAR